MNNLRPFIWLVTGALIISTATTDAEVIFEDNFDNQPDYNSHEHVSSQTSHKLYAKNGDPLPEGWDAISDYTTYDLPHLEITGDPEKTGSRGGKVLLMRRASFDPAWQGDSQFEKVLDRQYKELYISFWIRFQPNWTHDGQSKLFRVKSEPPGTRYTEGYWGRVGMGTLWQAKHYAVKDSGFRDALGVRPLMTDPPPGIPSPGWRWNDKGFNLSYNAHSHGRLTDHANDGGLLPTSGSVSHGQVFGDAWHKMEFHLKVNTAPGVQDGIYTQWMDGVKLIDNHTMAWLQNDTEHPDRGFNTVGFGGNDYFMAYPNEERVQEWYAFDDIVIRSDLPSERREPAPGAPTNVQIE